jgi:Peroxiredoxin
MKKLLLGLLPILALASCAKVPSYDIKVKLEGQPTAKMAYLQKLDNQDFITVDSAAIKDYKVEFKGKVDVPDLYFIRIGQGQAIQLFVENAKINVKVNLDSLDKVEVKGSATQDLFIKLNESMLPFRGQMEKLYKKADSLKMANAITPAVEKNLDIEYDSIQNQQQKFLTDFVANNKNSVVSAFVTYRILSHSLEFSKLEKITASFDSSLAKSPYVIKLKEMVELLRKTAVGQPYLDFTLPDPNGKDLSLSSLIDGKTVVMVDFWASWCSPCRQENPNVVAMYKELKGKGFQILGVSLDKQKENWVKAIKDDGITYPQVSDLKFWSCAAAKLYSVSSIPHTVLIGKDGKIAATDLRGDELKAKVIELLK